MIGELVYHMAVLSLLLMVIFQIAGLREDLRKGRK
jgi:hypothetical protein